MKVESSLMTDASYDKEREEMTVTYKNKGGTYIYQNVPPVLWAAFLMAPSKGKFFVGQIKNFPAMYPFRKIEKNDE